jgi:ubiquinone/menaquinone biosynthesis C-methylase UbiE|tara:strand:+ start:3199 stop:3828 length:630 start_codon:yes stop_codon:yes gene_type:complete
MKDLFKHEQEKYNVVHKYHGISENQSGYGRQLNELKTLNRKFNNYWNSFIDKKYSFLEVGLGAGENIRYLDSLNLDYCGIDISDFSVDELSELGLNVKHMSCHQMSFDDNSFDVVQHLDGMEHIPVEWEEKCLSEEVRVSKKYILYANAMGNAYLDSISKSSGYDEVHINIKNESEWDSFYEDNSSKYNYKILHKEIHSNTYYIILEKL